MLLSLLFLLGADQAGDPEKSGYAIQVDEEHLRVQLDTIQSELNAPTQFKVNKLFIYYPKRFTMCIIFPPDNT